MKLNISRITETLGYKSSGERVLGLYKEKTNFLQYELDNTKTKDMKLVFKNLNHRSMLHKHFMFEHFYIILIVVIVVCILSLFSKSYLMQLVAVAGVLYIPYKLISSSEVPYKLVLDGLNIYELNHVGKRIDEFNPNVLENSNSNTYENDFIFISGSNNSKSQSIKSLMIMEDYEFEVRALFRKHFSKFSFDNSIKARG